MMDNQPSTAFFWGVATSGYQHEGGYNSDGRPLNNWFPWENKGRVPRSGRTADFWNRYEGDFQLSRKLGLNAFRLSIEWARIQPTVDQEKKQDEPPPFDEVALSHYGDILVSARKHGLEPFVTLSHFTTPLWLGLDPWLEGKTADHFADFAAHALAFLNQYLIDRGVAPIIWMITINEPNMLVTNAYFSHSFPSGIFNAPHASLCALQQLCIAHCKAYLRIHALYAANPLWGKPMVSMNSYASDLYWMDKFITDILSAPSLGIRKDDLFEWLRERHKSFDDAFKEAMLPIEKTPPYWVGMLIKWLAHRIGNHIMGPSTFGQLADFLYTMPPSRPLDYLAIDYYDPFVGNIFRFPRFDEILSTHLSMRDWIMHSVTSKWWDWRSLPQGLRFFIGQYTRDYPDMQIIIAENGMALRKQSPNDRAWREDAISRSEYLRQHIHEVWRLHDEGCKLAGYFHWSLTDNYEWGTFAPRFGLYGVDFDSQGLERIYRQTDGDVAASTYARLIAEWRQSKHSSLS